MFCVNIKPHGEWKITATPLLAKVIAMETQPYAKQERPARHVVLPMVDVGIAVGGGVFWWLGVFLFGWRGWPCRRVRSLIWGLKSFFEGHFKKRSRRIDTVTALPSSAPL